MKIGIIGEDPYDTHAIKNLLVQKYPYRFKPILKKIKGDQLNSPKTRKLLKIELKAESYPIIIYTRDLDGLETEISKIEKIKNWFQDLENLKSRKTRPSSKNCVSKKSSEIALILRASFIYLSRR